MDLVGSVATSTYVKGSSVLGIILRVFKENALFGPTIDKELLVWSIPERLAICLTLLMHSLPYLEVLIMLWKKDLCFQRQGMS
ncbi:hypothetical protein Goarm_022941 [Gossypium armourianum]|uniref:Uncharacterized protein n=1 Tax=Gossypium armourianum TaxID=34283 RepID=A0A7J9KHQ0_9ROSI|nr:hypothetical protein [Gossypium armourianum]